MKWFIRLCVLLVFNTAFSQDEALPAKNKYILVIHGGAGTILKSKMTPEREKAYREALTLALKSGYAVLQKGGSSLDAVTAAVTIMEDSPLFNAGKGAVFTNEGRNELDAAIMSGKDQAAVLLPALLPFVTRFAARGCHGEKQSCDDGGTGAEKFAASQGIRIVDPTYFYTKNAGADSRMLKGPIHLKWNLITAIKNQVRTCSRTMMISLERSVP